MTDFLEFEENKKTIKKLKTQIQNLQMTKLKLQVLQMSALKIYNN